MRRGSQTPTGACRNLPCDFEALLTALLFLGCLAANGQALPPAWSGRITDESGTLIDGAVVRLERLDRPSEAIVVSSERGTYTIPALATVASVLKGGGTNALTSIATSTLTVYLAPTAVSTSGGIGTVKLSLLFHEALHGFGGTLGGTSFFDHDMQEALFGKNSPEVGAPSVSITNLIRSNCFK